MSDPKPPDGYIGRLRHTDGIPWFTVARDAAQDNNLTLEARGLLWLLLSLPPDWEVHAEPLARLYGHCGEQRIRTLIRELDTAGYVKRIRQRRTDGTVAGWDTYVRPHLDLDFTYRGNPPAGGESPQVEEPQVEIHPQQKKQPTRRERKHPPARNDETRPKPPSVETLDFGTRPDTNRAVAGVSELRHVLEATGQGPLCGTDPAPTVEHDTTT